MVTTKKEVKTVKTINNAPQVIQSDVATIVRLSNTMAIAKKRLDKAKDDVKKFASASASAELTLVINGSNRGNKYSVEVIVKKGSSKLSMDLLEQKQPKLFAEYKAIMDKIENCPEVFEQGSETLSVIHPKKLK